MFTCGVQRLTAGVLNHFSTFFLRLVLSLNLKFIDWPANSRYSLSAPQFWGCRCMTLCPTFGVGDWDLNSGLHACLMNILWLSSLHKQSSFTYTVILHCNHCVWVHAHVCACVCICVCINMKCGIGVEADSWFHHFPQGFMTKSFKRLCLRLLFFLSLASLRDSLALRFISATVESRQVR